MIRRVPPKSPRAQRGAVLFVSLILLLILTMIGVTAARMQTSEEAMARNEHNHQLAMQSAEAALRNAESALWIGTYSTADFAADNNGLYQLQSEITGANFASVADTVDWTAPGTLTQAYAGPALGSAPAAPQPAQIIIESLPPVARPGDPLCGSSYGQEQACSVYRVTAHAVGGDSSASATLQSIFH
jgi:type IV pilus assembly protein PilX